MRCQIARLGLRCVQVAQGLVIAWAEEVEHQGYYLGSPGISSKLAPSCIGKAASQCIPEVSELAKWHSSCVPTTSWLLTNPVATTPARRLKEPRQKTVPSSGGWVWQGGQGQAGMETVIQIPLRQAQDKKAESQNGQETNET